MRIAFCGSSLLSSYRNRAATYYRGLVRALALLGHRISFYEPDAFERQSHPDIEPPDWARVQVYSATPDSMRAAVARCSTADVVVKASGVGVFDGELLGGILQYAAPGAIRAFWDVDAPATIAAMQADPDHPVRRALPRLDMVFTHGGGEPVVQAYRALGAAACHPIYNALDPSTHFPVPSDPSLAADLSLMANRLPGREVRIEQFFFAAALRLPQRRLLLGGAGWHDKPMPANVRLPGHIGTERRNAFNCSATVILNVARDSMARIGFSPATRVFEVAGAGGCLTTDAWDGIELFLQPDEEALAARDDVDVATHLASLTPERARAIGTRARAYHARTYIRATCGGSGSAIASRVRAHTDAERGMRIVFLGLTLSASWGNGHATTYRALLRALTSRGHDILFLECDKPWYAEHRELTDPGFCRLAFYDDASDLERHRLAIAGADVVVIGSYVPYGVAVIDAHRRPQMGTWLSRHLQPRSAAGAEASAPAGGAASARAAVCRC